MWRDFFSTVFFLFAFVWYAQGQATRIYDNRDYGFGELSSNLTNSICQDKHGYIWTATEYGLNKFDGIRFIQYLHDVHDSTSISSNNINILYIDHNQRLWVGCNNGLQYYDENMDRFVRIHFPNQIAPHITDIIHKKDGRIWVATSGWGIFDIQVARRQALPLPRLNSLMGGMFARSIFEDRQHRIWVAVDRVGVSRISADQKQVQRINSDLLPQPKGGNYDIVQQTDGRLIFASPSKICRYDAAKNRFEAVAFKEKSQSTVSEIQLSKTKKDHLLISTEGDGLWYLDLNRSPLIGTRAELPNLDNDYRHGRIRTFLQDRENNLWLGWFQRGLVFIPVQSRQFEFWRILDLEQADKKTINAITRDQKGNIWYAVDYEGIFRADPQGISHQKIHTAADITKLETAADGTIWFSSYTKGLGQIDPATGQSNYLGICADKQVQTFTFGKNNKIYIATFGAGFVEYDNNTKASQRFNMNGTNAKKGALANDWIFTILSDKDGLIWLGHHKGVSCYDPANNSFSQYTGNKLSEQITLSLLDDGVGNIWAGTYNGLYQINKKSAAITSFTTNNGLSSNVISGIGQDQRGNIWCSSFKGINCLSPKTGKVVNYYTGDGLVDRSYNKGIYYQDAGGKIYYGGKQGITTFYPEKIRLQSYAYPVLITNLYVKNQPIKPGMSPSGSTIYRNDLMAAKEFFFHNNDDNFTFELSTMDFNSPENVYYEYRIKGINKSWNATLPGVNLITYNNLSSGDHELEIRACKFGAYSPSRTIVLHILPPWYLSGLAYFVYFLLILGIIFLISNYLHERRLEKLHAFRLQLFTDISHEIRSPLTLVMSPIDKLLKTATDPQTRSTLLNMNHNAQRILNLVNQLLDIRKLENGHLNLKFTQVNIVAFIKNVVSAFDHQATAHGIALTVHSQSEEIPLWIDANSFEKIIHNIMSNAFKFTPDGGKIELSLSSIQHTQFARESLQLVISDTGIGIPDSDIRHVFKRYYQSAAGVMNQRQGSGIGLHLTKVLVEKHGGQVYAENRKDNSGSRFVITFPMGNKHLNKEDLVAYKPSDAPGFETKEKINAQNQPASRSHYQKTDFKILVVDDDKDILQFLRQELASAYKVIEAENGSDGFQLALAELPDLIISDVAMPAMDGYMLVKKIKGNSITNHIPVILLTAKSNQEERMEGIGLGADAYLTKPFMVDELFMVTENLIKNRMKVKGKFSGAQQQEGKVKTISFKSSDELLMERILKTVNQYLENPEFNVQFLADEVGLSRVQLHRKVKALTGISTGEFIRNIRLQQAEKLLLEKKINISQVAYALGFTNQTHFTTLFKKMYGLSPTDYIQRHSCKES